MTNQTQGLKLHSWKMQSGDNIFDELILTSSKDIRIAADKVMRRFPKHYWAIKLTYNGIVER